MQYASLNSVSDFGLTARCTTMLLALAPFVVHAQEGIVMGLLCSIADPGTITYYIGWVALMRGGLCMVHVNVAKALFANVGLSQRNLFEVSVVCFLICAA